jgi:hypothetical protein
MVDGRALVVYEGSCCIYCTVYRAFRTRRSRLLSYSRVQYSTKRNREMLTRWMRPRDSGPCCHNPHRGPFLLPRAMATVTWYSLCSLCSPARFCPACQPRAVARFRRTFLFETPPDGPLRRDGKSCYTRCVKCIHLSLALAAPAVCKYDAMPYDAMEGRKNKGTATHSPSSSPQ